MPDFSIKLPHITEVDIVKAKELLAFSTLPYYQASGVFKSGQGAVAIGDPIAWDATDKKYIKYALAETAVSDEPVGTGDDEETEFDLANSHIVSATLSLKVGFATYKEYEHFVCDHKTGHIRFWSAPGDSLEIEATYSYYADGARCVGFVRIPGDSTDGDVAIEVLIGGAVKYSVVSDPDGENWNDRILEDLGAKYWEIADALIW